MLIRFHARDDLTCKFTGGSEKMRDTHQRLSVRVMYCIGNGFKNSTKVWKVLKNIHIKLKKIYKDDQFDNVLRAGCTTCQSLVTHKTGVVQK